MKTPTLGFYPRPRAGGDALGTPGIGSFKVFLSAPPCGGRLQLGFHCRACTRMFLSAPPCGGRLATGRTTSCLPTSFYPRPRAGGDRAKDFLCYGHWAFLSAPPCGGDRLPGAARAAQRVSIRAPVRGATYPSLYYIYKLMVSIRAPCGGRPLSAPARTHSPVVSIRAPVRGATHCRRHG